MSAPRRALLLGLAASAAACDDAAVAALDAGRDAPAVDARAAVDLAPADAPPTGPLHVRIEGAGYVYQGEETCLTAAHDGGADARVAWLLEPDGVRSSETRACRRWTDLGEFRAFVTVDARGMRAEASASLRVVARPSSPRPTASSTIAFDPTRSEVWVVNPDADSVAVLSAEPAARLAVVPVCRHPRTVAVSGATVAVACQDDGAVWLLDAATRTRRVAVDLGAGSRPYGVAADPRGGRFFVTLQDLGRLVVLDAATGATVGSVDVGFDARAVTVNALGTALVGRWRGDADGARVVQVDAADPAAPRRVALALLPRQEDLDSDTDNSGVPSFLGALAFAPSGRRAIVPALKANVVTGTFRTREPLTSQTTARAVLSDLWLGDGAAAPAEATRYSFDDHDYASAVAFSPQGDRVYAALQGSEIVVALDPDGFNITGSIAQVGGAPQGLALSPDGRLLFVHGFTSRTVRVYDVRDLSRPAAPLADVATVAAEALAADVALGQRIFYASRDPRMSRTSYLSCASCHQDGEGDNLVWDFTQRGEGLRNTIPLRGRGGALHGPMHWSANFDEVQDFEHDIRGPQGGAGFLADDVFHGGGRDAPLGAPKAGLSPELDALAAYVGSLRAFGPSPTRRPADPAWVASWTRGRDLFRGAAAGCATCHAGPRMTDSAFGPDGRTPLLHDVGTLSPGSGMRLGGPLPGIDTPTLLDLWRTAPYLHDGSAATLRDVLVARNRGDRHGRTSALTTAQLNDLETFLLAAE
jgi:DNA-binding beta-propeller fold protein YncE